jgi:tetratricopeptide (TPR) repeat protein
MLLRVQLLRRRFTATLIVVGLVAFTGCATVPDRPQVIVTGDAVVDGNAQRAAAPVKDRALWDFRVAASALRAANPAEAKLRLDDALPLIGGILANDADAKRARGLFSAESTKTFIGEPYERVMAYYYRGLLYWRDGQPDNARACYRSGQLIDSDAEAVDNKSDYVLLDYLDGFASAKLAGDGSDAFARAQANAKGKTLPPYDPAANVLIFAEFGRGPRKYSGGEYGEQLKFFTKDSAAYSATLAVNGETVVLPAYDDLNFQATTRGGRVMDHILGGKAVFKRNTDVVGNVALVGAAIAADNAYGRRRRPDGTIETYGNRDAQTAAVALGAIGLLSKLASAATTPQADIRMWDNLPQRLSFAALRLGPGEYPATLEFQDAAGRTLPGLTQTLKIQVEPADRDTVIFLSELKR